MLEELFGGGHRPSSSNTNNSSNTTPTTTTPAEQSSAPATGSADRTEDDTSDAVPAEDDVPANEPVDGDDGTYGSAPVTEEPVTETPANDQPATIPPGTQNDAQPDDTDGLEAPTETDQPSASAPVAQEQADDTDETDTDEEEDVPTATAPVAAQPAATPVATPGAGASANVGASASVATASYADPLKRVTDLVADYTLKLSQDSTTDTEVASARQRAVDLAQNRVVANLMTDLSPAGATAKSYLLADNDDSDAISLINKYYAEA